jgi:hypothetical protein
MAEKHYCKFCGVHTDTPCVDETDLHIYSRTVDRCSDAAFNLAEDRPLPHPPHVCGPISEPGASTLDQSQS